ncbi:MAG: thiol reductase thioredoxin [Caulobacteraceae bacterium]|nr:thiol reductase thioredoxin [Caulobacter sp.]
MTQLVCPSCGAVNRLPQTRDPLEGRCGKCHAPLLTGAPIEVTGPELQRRRASTQGVALLLDVWAPWCGPCRTMAPQFAAAAAQLEPQVQLLKLNSEAEPQAAAAMGVQGIPALFLIRDGAVVARTAGAMPSAQIVAWARNALAGAAT